MTETVRIVCGECLATNRVPHSRLADRPSCGRCKGPLFRGEPVDVDDHGLVKMLAGNDIPVVIDFWAPWCGPCLGFAPVFRAAAAGMEPHYRFLKLDTEENPQSGVIHQVRSIPTLAVFRGGRELARRSGALSQEMLRQFLTQQAG